MKKRGVSGPRDLGRKETDERGVAWRKTRASRTHPGAYTRVNRVGCHRLLGSARHRVGERGAVAARFLGTSQF